MFDQKPPITLQSELAEIDRAEGKDTQALHEIKQQLIRFNSNSNTLDPVEFLADKWGRNPKTGKVWTREMVAAVVREAVRVRREMNALNPEAWELFVSVLTTGEKPDWYRDWE
jgi:hypothetical protein